MPTNDDSDYLSAHEGVDSSNVLAIQIQQRISRLKKKRDDRMDAVLQESNHAFNDLRSRVIVYQVKQRKKESQTCATHMAKLMGAVERRKEIEAKMEKLTKELFLATQELEGMMHKGYDGREKDMEKQEEGNESNRA